MHISQNKIISNELNNWFDKIDQKFLYWSEDDFKNNKIRAVPGCFIRKSAYIAPNVILMPSFVNVGAFVDSGTMIDTWSTIGSCAQIGKNCHISGGVGIGGVLEPIQNNPVIIEDNCFIGARSEIAEGVIIGEGSVIGMGCYIASSTKIVNRNTKEITYGYIPPYSVVVPGNIKYDDNLSTYCLLIIKNVDEKTRSKTKINELLRF
jgi:2,3,4,5-tetrahydropyridine-2-carboxylate N-succinyltransferase